MSDHPSEQPGSDDEPPLDDPSAEHDFVARPAVDDFEPAPLPPAANRDRVREALAEVVQQGLTVREAAAKYGVDAHSIHLWRRRYNTFVRRVEQGAGGCRLSTGGTEL